MAANNYISLRQPNSLDFFDKDIGETLKGLINGNYKSIWIWEFILNQESPDAVAEARVDFTDEFNEEAAPKIFAVQGAAANEDKAAGTGARSIIVFGIDTDGNPNSEIIGMHATAGTLNDGVTLWKRFVGAMVYTAGTGLVNAGKIEIINHADTAVYGTIATGENCTIGTRVYVPADYNAFIGHICAACTAAPHATDELTFGDGIIIEPLYLTSPNVLNKDSYFIRVEERMKDAEIVKYIITGANTRYISFKHGTKAQDANLTATIHMRIIMYGTTDELRGLV